MAGVIFTWIFSRDFGLFNQFLGAIGLGAWEHGWVADPHYALAVIVVVQLWLLLGVGMLIFLAGLRSIPGELYDAASVDGAGPAQTFFLVTVPNLRIHFVIASVWGLVQAVKIFGVPYVMTHGGPAGATETCTSMSGTPPSGSSTSARPPPSATSWPCSSSCFRP